MTSPTLRGADAVARTLERAGVRYVFTLSGNHVMPVFDAVLDTTLRLIHTRHEAAAVHMADAWGRLTGAPGIALVTGGPGHANAVSALYTARMAESPMVLLSGHAPRAELGRGAFQEMDQAAMAQPVTKASWTVERAEYLARDVARALRIARSGRPGPVHVSLPSDLLEARFADDALSAFASVAPGPIASPGSPASKPASPSGVAADASALRPDAFVAEAMPLAADALDALLRHLALASRPLLLLGPHALAAHVAALREKAARALGVPVIATDSPRGTNDPALGALASVLRRADLVVLIGKRVDFTLRFGAAGAFAADTRFVVVDPDTDERERATRALGERLVACHAADVPATLATLAHSATAMPGRSAWQREVSERLQARVTLDGAHTDVDHEASAHSGTTPAHAAGSRLHPAAACAPIQALLDRHPDAVIVCDGGEFGQWAQACLSSPRRVINGPAGAIGPALPMALAARLAHPDAPVIALSGDGAFGFHIAELDTAVRYGLPVIAVVGNDARWNAEHQIQLRSYGPDRLIGCDLLPTRYDRVAEGFGAIGEHVERSDDLAAALQRALASNRPACIDVAIDSVPAPTLPAG